MGSKKNVSEHKNPETEGSDEIDDCNESVINKLLVEKDKHQETFFYDLIFITATYLKERKIGFTVDEILNAWENPSTQDGAKTEIFFYNHVLLPLRKSAADEKKLDYLVALFLRHVTEMIGSQALAELNKSRSHKTKTL